MAADVDKTTAENGRNISNRTERHSPATGSWVCKGLWTVLLVGAVPLVALGVKYYQDAQLIKRHVRSFILFYFYFHSFPLIPIVFLLRLIQKRKRGSDVFLPFVTVSSKKNKLFVVFERSKCLSDITSAF